MLPDVENLISLQHADREISRLKEEIAALPNRVAAIEKKLAGTEAVLNSAKAAVKADEADRRKYESTIQDLQQKISKYREQSLEVKTNEHYKALMHEIEFAEKDIRSSEDKILELMMNAEAREKTVKAAEADLKAEREDIEKEKSDARQKTAEDEQLVAAWSAKREKARSCVDADLLRHYDTVSKFRRTGLAEVRDQKCMGCQVMLRPQTYNDVRGGQTVICESCQRILYFDPANEVVAERPSLTAKRRVRPKYHIDRGWFYLPDFPDVGEVFVAFANADGNASRRVYDAHTGRRVGPIETKSGDFMAVFAEDVKAGIHLKSGLDEQQLDQWDPELPMAILDELNGDLKAARENEAVESGSRSGG
ncbi:MAG: hypothetical protein JOY93_00405, partial [Acidobacteriales bacterium]|nr:hypothetical protein [Terriglobales bacterium]